LFRHTSLSGESTTSTTGTTTNPNTHATATTNTTSSSTSPQSSTIVTYVITNNRNILESSSSSSSSNGGGTALGTTPSQTTNNNNFLTYLNTPDKITIRYSSTWTKTEFANNPSIPVIFNAPINGTTTAKTTLMVNLNNQLTPSSATSDAYTQQINALTKSSVIKYIITDTNSKVLTPTGIAAYREISYNGIKISTVNNIPTQIPLK
jgi:hypothetical protein